MSADSPVTTTVIIPAFNYERYVEECIASCVGQEEPHGGYEIVLIDDGSTDGTAEIARRFEPRVHVIATENGGIERAANLGLQKARGRFVLRVDADDRLRPEYLRSMVPALERRDVAFVYSEYETIDAQGRRTGTITLPDFDPQEISFRGDFLATGTLYRKSAVMQLGAYNERVMNSGLENFELILRMLASGLEGYCVHTMLFGHRFHGANLSTTRKQSIIEYGRRLASEFGLPGYRTNEFHPSGLTL